MPVTLERYEPRETNETSETNESCEEPVEHRAVYRILHVPATDWKRNKDLGIIMRSKDLVVIASTDRVLDEPNEMLSRIQAYPGVTTIACTDCGTIDVIIMDAGVRASDLRRVLRRVQTCALGSIVYAYDTDRVISRPSNPPFTFIPLATVWRHAREAGVAPVSTCEWKTRHVKYAASRTKRYAIATRCHTP